MAQLRYFNYGAPFDNVSEKEVHYALHAKGVYRGFALSVNADHNLVMGAGYGMQHDGIIWKEDADRTFLFTAPAVPSEYTLVATHEDRSILGGVPVEYDIESGIISNEAVADGVAIGWIHHPGGVPLALEHITEAPKFVENDYAALVAQSLPMEQIPPFTRYANSAIGTDITFTESEFDAFSYLVYEKVANAPAAVPAIQQLVQNVVLFVQSGIRPTEIEVYEEFPNSPNTNLTVELFDTNQAPVVVTGGTINGSGAWTYHSIQVDQTSGTFDDEKPYTVRLTFNVNKGEYIRLGRLRVHFWKYF